MGFYLNNSSAKSRLIRIRLFNEPSLMRDFLRLPILVLSVFLFHSCGTESTPTYTLTTSVVGEGTISPSGGTYEEGEIVTLTSSPNNGWLFESWGGDGSGSSSSLVIIMDGDKNVAGNFQRRDFSLKVTIEGGGTVQEEIISSPKTTEYPYETVIQLTPNPLKGWKFESWSGDISSTDEVIEVNVDRDVNLIATFSGIIYLGDNGITIMCPNSKVGDLGIVNDIEYEVVDRELLFQRYEEGMGKFNRRVCVSLITNMSSMFLESNFSQLIDDWDVSNVTSMTRMFLESQFNKPIADWDVSNVTNMDRMFESSQFNQPLDSWNVGSVASMSFMFYGSPFNQPIGDWDVSSVTNMMWMFVLSPFNHPIGKWDVSNVTKMEFMFHRTQFNQDISQWCVWRIKSLPNLFSYRSPLTLENHPKWGTCPD